MKEEQKDTRRENKERTLASDLEKKKADQVGKYWQAKLQDNQD